MNNKTELGKITGNLSLKTIDENGKTFSMLFGDPEGLKSLGEILIKMAQIDQSKFKGMVDGDRFHMHIYPGFHLSLDSNETILGRLDAKGTGEFPPNHKSSSEI